MSASGIESIQTSIAAQVATLTLSRPERHNAFDDALIEALALELQRLADDPAVRALVLTGAGASFSAGADLGWMRRVAEAGLEENQRDAQALAALMRTLYLFPKPTIARVNGAAYGGGVGLVACCDIAIASDQAKFGLTETRLGLVPAVISPYVVSAIGARQARRYFQSAEIFDAASARALGLVHDVVPASGLDAAISRQVELLLRAGPAAVYEAKRLVQKLSGLDAERLAALDLEHSILIADLRASAEGREGLGAFLEKRTPGWVAANGAG
jgi:methylglutaconyl-CoA hydratase